nr:putative epoxide hydrolase [Quercus suber]
MEESDHFWICGREAFLIYAKKNTTVRAPMRRASFRARTRPNFSDLERCINAESAMPTHRMFGTMTFVQRRVPSGHQFRGSHIPTGYASPCAIFTTCPAGYIRCHKGRGLMANVASSSTIGTPMIVHPYRIFVSQKYLDLTRRKLELTRLPRSPQGSFYDYSGGVTKDELEPLIDHWAETYDWRAQEAHYNEVLPQFRTSLNGTRLHFVHKRSASPNAIALLFVHGWPESFLSVAPMIDALCDPASSKAAGEENMPAFHVVAPSVPGLGFSDAVSEESNNMQMTAAMMDALMRSLGYVQYIAHGSGQ